MIINPQLAAAREMARLLKFPSALKVDSFAKAGWSWLIFGLRKEIRCAI